MQKELENHPKRTIIYKEDFKILDTVKMLFCP